MSPVIPLLISNSAPFFHPQFSLEYKIIDLILNLLNLEISRTMLSPRRNNGQLLGICEGKKRIGIEVLFLKPDAGGEWEIDGDKNEDKINFDCFETLGLFTNEVCQKKEKGGGGRYLQFVI